MNPRWLFGRNLRDPEPGPDRPDPADWPTAVAETDWPDPVGGPATRAARPRPLRSPTDDPPTDPHGWPAVHPADPAGESRGRATPESVPLVSLPFEPDGLEARLRAAAAATLLDDVRPNDRTGPEPLARGTRDRAMSDSGRTDPEPAISSPTGLMTTGPRPVAGPPPARWSPTEQAEAIALAVAFATDYLSWDESDAARRGRVLAGYLESPDVDPGRLGWDGTGRQRADFAVPGRTSVGPDGRLEIDVRARVTPYHRVGERGTEPEPERTGTPAVAPAPSGRGWRSLSSQWVRLTVPVLRDGPRLVIARRDSPAAPATDPDP